MKAAQTGERQEVVGQRTPYATTYANPDGQTFTLEQSAIPLRVKEPDGSWTAPDATLERRADGSVGPKAAVAGLSFSGGGDGMELVTVSNSGRSLRVGWPGALPAPTLTGATAQYADVLPGVDLQLTATAEGNREVLVVTTAEAATSTALKELHFPVQTQGLTLRDGALGSLSAVDENGSTVFRAPAAQQWDSAGNTDTPAESPAKALPRAAASAVDASGELAPDPASGPGVGDASAVLPVHADAASITVVPDEGMLKADDAVFPQYIDPNVSWGEAERTLLSSGPDTSYNFAGGSDGKGVGRCSIYVSGEFGYVCSESPYTNRMYFEFSPAQLVGKQVMDATFRVTERWSMSCTPSVVDLVRTGNISSATRWPGPASSGWDLMVDRTVSAGRGTACSPDQPAAPIEFHDDAKQSNENLTSTVKSFAAGSFSRLTLMLKAHDEGDPNGWKRFDDDAVLAVTYVGLPAPPTSVGIVEGTGTSCETNAADPDVISDPTPTMAATAQTVAGGESGASLLLHFYVQKKNSDATWSLLSEPIRPTSGFIGDNSALSATLPTTLSEGVLYRLAVFTRSYYSGGALESHSTVTTKGWCYFQVDTTAPKAPTVTFGSPYSACTANACAPGGGPGVEGAFTFAPASGDTRNVAYQYKLSSSAAWSSKIPGATVHTNVVPQLAGTQQLQVRAQDSVGSGRWGAKTIVDFKVAEPAGASGRWHFDDQPPGSTITTAEDSATEGIRHPATLYTAAAGWSTFARRGDGDRSLWLNDTTNPADQSGYAATQTPAVNTQSSFTVSAWTYLTDDSAFHGVLSQMGSDGSGFSLYYSPAVKRWVFLWNWNEGGVQKWVGANADATGVPLKAWTQLAGVYDKDKRTIGLYVNGRLQGTPVELPAASLAQTTDGALQFGRRSASFGTYQDYWRGRIDEVAVWQGARTPDLIAAESRLLDSSGNPAVEMTAAWSPAGASGTTLPDTTSPYARSLTLSGGAALDGESLVLDGVDDAVTAPGPLVDDTGSFTVTTEVALNQTALLTKPDGYSGQVLGQRSADGSAWGLWYHRDGSTTTLDDDGNIVTVPKGYWEFGRLETDGTFSAVQSTTEAELGTPVQLLRFSRRGR